MTKKSSLLIMMSDHFLLRSSRNSEKAGLVRCNSLQWVDVRSIEGVYLKKFYNDDPHFADAKVIYSVYNSISKEAWTKAW